MAIERTFSIIKPDAVERNKIGEITAMLEASGLRIVASKRIQLNQEKAAAFYGVHADKPFFESLCDYMCSLKCTMNYHRILGRFLIFWLMKN